MAIEHTLSIIKPDAVKNNKIGAIVNKIEERGLKIIAMKMVQLTTQQAEGFYAEHKERPFFAGLVEFMTSGPVVVQVLKGDNAVSSYRELMGATDPQQAEPETLRALFAASKGENAVHGSDSSDAAAREIAYFFGQSDVFANR